MRQVELITWVDPYVLDRPWNSEDEINEKLSHMNCHTVGYVARETDEFVVLAQGFSLKEDGETIEEWGHCWVLPKICIVNREPLYYGGPPTYAQPQEAEGFCTQHQTFFSNKHPVHEQRY